VQIKEAVAMFDARLEMAGADNLPRRLVESQVRAWHGPPCLGSDTHTRTHAHTHTMPLE